MYEKHLTFLLNRCILLSVHACDRFGNPCENGGTCIKEGDSHSCLCTEGYTGHHCDNEDKAEARLGGISILAVR